jgi:type I restriction enzyme, S subunit
MKDAMAVSQHFMAWQCGPQLDNHFLYYWLQAEKSEFERIANGNTIKTIGLPHFKALQIPLPPPSEQRAIATALSDLDALICSLDQLIAKNRDLKRAAMQLLLTGKQRLPGFQGEWEVWTFGELFRFLNTANNPRADLSPFGDFGYIHYGDIHMASPSFLDCADADLPLIDEAKVASIPRVEDGDLVMADASEDYSGIGKCVEVRNVSGRRIVAGLHTFLLRSNKELLADGFKGYLQFIPSVKTSLVKLATGISVYGISKSNVNSLEVLLPPVEEQRAITAVLSDMDAEIAALEQRRDKTRAIKQGMMQELLTGRTRLV